MEVSREKDDCDITGEAVPQDPNDASARMPFELKFKCR